MSFGSKPDRSSASSTTPANGPPSRSATAMGNVDSCSALRLDIVWPSIPNMRITTTKGRMTCGVMSSASSFLSRTRKRLMP